MNVLKSTNSVTRVPLPLVTVRNNHLPQNSNSISDIKKKKKSVILGVVCECIREVDVKCFLHIQTFIHIVDMHTCSRKRMIYR